MFGVYDEGTGVLMQTDYNKKAAEHSLEVLHDYEKRNGRDTVYVTWPVGAVGWLNYWDDRLKSMRSMVETAIDQDDPLHWESEHIWVPAQEELDYLRRCI
jgi:hypothetical protein